MKNLILLMLTVCLSGGLMAQGNYKKKKRRSDYFGGAPSSRDLSEMRNFGLQITVGPNYTFTRLKNPLQESSADAATRYNYTLDPSGRFGGFIGIGMVHYRMKKPSFLKKNIIHYIDWGLGFDLIGGKQKTTINYLDAGGTTVGTADGDAAFYNGYAYGRLTAHRLLKLSSKVHLDYGLGFNLNYAVMKDSDQDPVYIADNERFQKDFLAQIHAQLGVNIRISRGDYLVPGIWAPVIGAYEWNSARPTIQWFSSNYWPVHFQVKWLHSFTKKSSGCNTGSPEDRKRSEEYMNR